MSANLLCQSCGHENDPTRVFCQNCGIRLERPADETTEAAPAPPPPTTGIKRTHSTSTQTGGWKLALILVRMVISSAILGAVLAVAVLVWRKPADLPVTDAISASADKAWADIKAAAEYPYQRSVDIPEGVVNAYLAKQIQFKESPLNFLGGGSDSRFMLHILHGRAIAVLQTPAAGGNKYLQVTFRPVLRNNGLSAVVEGGSLGRLNLPPSLAKYLVRFMRPAIDALQPEIEVLAQAEAIDLNTGMVRVVYGTRP